MTDRAEWAFILYRMDKPVAITKESNLAMAWVSSAVRNPDWIQVPVWQAENDIPDDIKDEMHD